MPGNYSGGINNLLNLEYLMASRASLLKEAQDLSFADLELEEIQ